MGKTPTNLLPNAYLSKKPFESPSSALGCAPGCLAPKPLLIFVAIALLHVLPRYIEAPPLQVVVIVRLDIVFPMPNTVGGALHHRMEIVGTNPVSAIAPVVFRQPCSPPPLVKTALVRVVVIVVKFG